LFLFYFLGITGSLPTEGSIDEANPSSKEEFVEFKNNLVKKLQSLSTKACYNDFIEDFIKDVCIGCKSDFLKVVVCNFLHLIFLNPSGSRSSQKS
jgi:hypothetical protein